MPKKVMQKGRKIEPKWDQNGSQNVTEIEKSWKKEGPKNDAKNVCGKVWVRPINPGSTQGRFWSAGG